MHQARFPSNGTKGEPAQLRPPHTIRHGGVLTCELISLFADVVIAHRRFCLHILKESKWTGGIIRKKTLSNGRRGVRGSDLGSAGARVSKVDDVSDTEFRICKLRHC